MAKQNNQSITIIQEQDELALPDRIVYPLQGAKIKRKTDQQLFRKYTLKPPVNSPLPFLSHSCALLRATRNCLVIIHLICDQQVGANRIGQSLCVIWYLLRFLYSQSRSRVNSNSKNEMNIRISLCNVRRVNEMLDISQEVVPKKTH